MAAEKVGAERGVLGVYPGGGRSIWLLGMLITFKAVSEETGGEYSVFEQTVPPRAGVPPHMHHQESEAFYVLEGEFELLTGGQPMKAYESRRRGVRPRPKGRRAQLHEPGNDARQVSGDRHTGRAAREVPFGVGPTGGNRDATSAPRRSAGCREAQAGSLEIPHRNAGAARPVR